MNVIEITINGKTHTFEEGDVSSIKSMSWNDRKKLIKVLEQVKQVEYIDKESPTKKVPVMAQKTINSVETDSKPNLLNELDGAVKPGKGDVDSIMSRLILEQQSSQTPIPDKGVVIKWMLVIIGVILLIAFIT